MSDAALPRGTVVFPPIVQVHFDGACQTVNGVRVAAYGFTVEGANLDHEEFGLAVRPGSEHATSNVAEYTAAIRSLEYLKGQAYRETVLMFGDSQLVIRQMTGEYLVRSEHLHAYHDRLRDLAKGFLEVRYHWVARGENQRADWLSKRALDTETTDSPPRVGPTSLDPTPRLPNKGKTEDQPPYEGDSESPR